MKPLKILFLTSWYPNREEPQNGDFIQRHAQAVATIHQVEVLYAHGLSQLPNKYEIDTRTINGVTEYIIYYRKSPYKFINLWRKYTAYRKGFQNIFEYDLIHHNVIYPMGIIPLLLHVFKGKKYVLTEHFTGYLPSQNYSFSVFQKALIKLIVKHAEYVLPVSNDLGNAIKQNFSNNTFRTILNVVDTDVFHYQDHQNEIPVFLHASSLKETQKNISGILRVIKKLSDEGYKFVFQLGGGNLSYCQAYIRTHSLEDKVILFPNIPHEEIAQLMQQADCFVLFSNFENQPCVIPESFSSGLDVITTDVGGISEFFPKSFGTLIKYADENELFDTLKDYIVSFESRDKKVTEKRMYVEKHFSVSTIAKQLDSIYRSL